MDDWIEVAMVVFSIILVIQLVAIIGLFHAIAGVQTRFDSLRSQTRSTPLQLGDSISDGVHTTLDGTEILLSAQWSMRPVALVFLSTGCNHCDTLLSQLVGLTFNGEIPSSSILLLAAGPRSAVDSMLKTHSVPPELRSIPTDLSSIAHQFRIYATPTVVVVSKAGTASAIFRGPVSSRTVADSLIAESEQLEKLKHPEGSMHPLPKQ